MDGFDVFISYSSKNKEIADAVVAGLEQSGIRCWYAPRNITPGKPWATAIRQGMEAASVFVLLYTEDSNRSEQVKNEVALAFNLGLTLLPFRLSDTAMEPELEYYLMRVHWLDALSGPLESNITALRKLTEEILYDKKQKKPETEATEILFGQICDSSPKNNRGKYVLLLASIVGILLIVFLSLQASRKTVPQDEYSGQQADTEGVLPTQAETTTPAVTDSGTATAAVRSEKQNKGGDLLYTPPDHELPEEDLPKQLCFTSAYQRGQIATITFCSSIPETEEVGLDVSVAGDGSVMAWFSEKAGGLYDLTIAADGKIHFPKDCYEMFAGYDHMTAITFADAVDTAATEDMAGMFRNCSCLKELDLAGFSTASVRDLSYFVCGDTWLEFIDLDSFATSKAESMRCMFWECSALQELSLQNFDTSACTDMNGMFRGCRTLRELDVSGFSTANVTDMFSMFYGLASLEKPLPLQNFDTSRVKNMYWMFTGYPLAELDVSSFDTSGVENMKNMFGSCKNLRTLDLGNWDFSKVTNAEYMFSGDTDLTVYVDRTKEGWEAFADLDFLLENTEQVEFVQK